MHGGPFEVAVKACLMEPYACRLKLSNTGSALQKSTSYRTAYLMHSYPNILWNFAGYRGGVI